MRFCHMFFEKQKTAYEMRISDWSSDVCSSDLPGHIQLENAIKQARLQTNFVGIEYLRLIGRGSRSPDRKTAAVSSAVIRGIQVDVWGKFLRNDAPPCELLVVLFGALVSQQRERRSARRSVGNEGGRQFSS